MAQKHAAKVVLDLNSPTFQKEYFSLDKTELAQVTKALKKALGMEWAVFERHPGFRWEALAQLPKVNGHTMFSMRLSQKYRALAFREGPFLRVLSLHLDHDSAYEK